MTFRRVFTVITGLLLISTALWAGDSASFVDLGFSPDGNTYIFAQYGVRSGNLRPWADMFIVDVTRNDFVRGGRISYIHQNPINAGQDGSGALYHVIMSNASIAGRYGVQFPNQGMPLYIALEGDPAYNGDTITFRNFNSGSFFRASLLETITGSGRDLRSSFYIFLEHTDRSGNEKTYRIGTPIERPFIFSYRIKKVLTSSDSKSLIFVIEMKRLSDSGSHDIRYMVEAIRF